jgi:hypothetical protein
MAHFSRIHQVIKQYQFAPEHSIHQHDKHNTKCPILSYSRHPVNPYHLLDIAKHLSVTLLCSLPRRLEQELCRADEAAYVPPIRAYNHTLLQNPHKSQT